MSNTRNRSTARWTTAVLTVLAATVGVVGSQAAATPAPVAAPAAVQQLASAAQGDSALLVWNNTGS